MNLLDGFILLVLVGGAISGFHAGLIKQVTSLLGMVLAFLLGMQLMEPVGALAADSLGFSPALAPVVGFILVFLLVQLVVFALTKLIEAVLGALQLTVVNRVAGSAVGTFKSALILSVLFLALGYLSVPGPQSRSTSVLYQPISSVVPVTWDFAASQLPALGRLTDRFTRNVQTHFPVRQVRSGS